MTPTTQALKSSTASPPVMRQPAQMRYSGPPVPTAYDPNWQKYTNLTKPQIAWFQAQPQDLITYATLKVQQADVTSFTHSSGIVVHPVLNGASVKFSLPGKDIHTAARRPSPRGRRSMQSIRQRDDRYAPSHGLDAIHARRAEGGRSRASQ